jgi:hypothetical protein
MASGKYIGYVGGMAVAVGVGAAIAAAGHGTANADTDSKSTTSSKGSDSSAGATDAGPKKADAKNAGAKKADAKKAERPKPLKDLEDRAEKVTASLTKKVTGKKSAADKRAETAVSDTDEPARTATTRKPKPTPEEFEAGQVRTLKDLFQPKEAAAPTPDTDTDTDTEADAPVTTAAEPWSPNPFRPEDPTPTDMPADVVALRDALVGAAIAPEFQPFIREGVEAGYRVSQMVPWVNVVVPLTKIVPALPEAIGGDPAAKDATQIIVNELLKTTQPVSLLYYGYDELADLANLESEGDALKQQFYVNAWNILDPFAILHNPGTSGIGNGAGTGLTV